VSLVFGCGGWCGDVGLLGWLWLYFGDSGVRVGCGFSDGVDWWDYFVLVY